MPDIVKILFGLAAFGALASIVMIVLNIVAGRHAAAADYEDYEAEEDDGEVIEEDNTRDYSPAHMAEEEPLFTPLGEEDSYDSREEPETVATAFAEEPEDGTSEEVSEIMKLYKKEKEKAELKGRAVITPAVVEYEEEPETVSLPEEYLTVRQIEKKMSPSEPVTVMQTAEKGAEAREESEPEEDEAEELIASMAPHKAQPVEAASAIVGDLRLSVGNAQHIGTREQQQDAFAITPLEEKSIVMSHGVMAVVCDGMGGLENGAEAANLGAVNFMRNYMRQEQVGRDSLLAAVTETNSVVYDTFCENETPAGTTLAAASVLPSGLRFVSVGDSHIYLYRRGRIYQINRDHNYFSELMEQVKTGRMTLEEAQTHPERAHLTSYVGLKKLEKVDYNTEAVALRPGDRVLLCTDGLFKTLSLEEIASTIAESGEFDAQDKLMDALLAKGKRRQDNVTIVVLYCDKV